MILLSVCYLFFSVKNNQIYQIEAVNKTQTNYIFATPTTTASEIVFLGSVREMMGQKNINGTSSMQLRVEVLDDDSIIKNEGVIRGEFVLINVYKNKFPNPFRLGDWGRFTAQYDYKNKLYDLVKFGYVYIDY